MALVNIRPIDPLRYDVPIVDQEGRPTPQFARQWVQARQINLTTDDISIAVETLQQLIEQAQLLLEELTARQIIAGDGLDGTGDLSADVTLSVDSSVVRTSRQVNSGTGLTGGGDLSANRTLALADTAVTPGTYAPPLSITVDQQGRITAIT